MLQSEVRKHVEAGSALYTDALKSYDGLDEFQHQVVDHAVEYMNGKIHTQRAGKLLEPLEAWYQRNLRFR